MVKLNWRTKRSTSGPADAELRERLTRQQYRVTQKGATERPFSGAYHATKMPGTYRCVVCDSELFESRAKFDSGTGWPSFDRAIERGRVRRRNDRKLGVLRVETRCANCDAHLGHVFPDGPLPTGERYCINSAALSLDPADTADPDEVDRFDPA